MHCISFTERVRLLSTSVTVSLLALCACAASQPVDTPEQLTRLGAAADRLLPLLDLEREEMRRVKRLAAKGDKVEALRVWRDRLVNRMRQRDYHEFYQHDYSRHPRQVGVADMLAGVVSREDYLRDASKTGFLDIFDMAGAPERTHRIDWFA